MNTFLWAYWQTSRAGNGGFKVREFVDIFCAHPPKLRQSGRRNKPNFTTPNAENPTSSVNAKGQKKAQPNPPNLQVK